MTVLGKFNKIDLFPDTKTYENHVLMKHKEEVLLFASICVSPLEITYCVRNFLSQLLDISKFLYLVLSATSIGFAFS